MSTHRDRIASKVRALLSKTTAAGCTESEALSAAELASSLMAEHDLTYADVLDDLEETVRGERYGARLRPFVLRGQPRHEVSGCLGDIAYFWDCLAFICHESGDLIMFGAAADTLSAHAMADLLRAAIDTEWATYYASPDRDRKTHGRKVRTSFMAGIVWRINERLAELKNTRSGASKTGTALVVARAKIVQERWETYTTAKQMTVTEGSAPAPVIASDHAFLAGQAAGERVGLHHGD